jgi:ABC-2 type transport system ATP-binding protein
MAEYSERVPYRLSIGEKKRISIATVLAMNPEILVLDEPTAGLDPNQIRDFRRNLKALGKRKTILVSTHILSEVEATADRVLLIHSGKMIFDGSPAELKQEGSLEEPFYRLTNYGRPLGSSEEEVDAAPAGPEGENDAGSDTGGEE